MRPVLALTLKLAALFISFGAAAESIFVSKEEQVTLVELYTSEGCSSCPPADRWLARYRESDSLWNDVIPVAFHVDYWDYLGWKDAFSSSAYSDRQRTYAAQRHIASVYTPGIVVDGAEYRDFFNPVKRQRPVPASSQSPGRLILDRSGETVRLEYRGDRDEDLIAHLVYLGLDLETRVRRGENAGRNLEHQFVVLGHHTVRAPGDFVFDTHAIPAGADAIAAWISKPDDLRPLQAVGGEI